MPLVIDGDLGRLCPLGRSAMAKGRVVAFGWRNFLAKARLFAVGRGAFGADAAGAERQV